MPIEKYEDLNPMQLDVLREIGNIGSGNAATALADMMGRAVSIEVPQIKIMGFQEALEFAGGPETIIVGILIRMQCDIEGMIMFLLEEPFARTIITNFYGDKPVEIINLDKNDVSVLNEIGNIMGGSYVNALASLTGLTIDVTVPSMAVDMLGAIMSVPAIEFGEVGEKVLLINEKFIIDAVEINANMMLIPTVDSLQVLLRRLGVADE